MYNPCIDKSYFPSLNSSNLKSFIYINLATLLIHLPKAYINFIFLSKPLEKHVYGSVYPYLNNNRFIRDNQSGFPQNHSYHTTLIQLIDNLLANIDQNELTGILFVDFAKAFDVKDHSLLQ